MSSTSQISPALLKKLRKHEKRKRIQVYTTMDTLFNLNTFVDFYSKDLIDILTNAKILAYKSNESDKSKPLEITSEHILYAFFLTPTKVQDILYAHNLRLGNAFEEGKELILSYQKEKSSPTPSKLTILDYLKKKYFNFSVKESELEFILRRKIGNNYVFSNEVTSLFLKSVSDAMERYRTPVVTPEIFIITLMESKPSKVSKLIKKLMKEKNEWHILRYQLLKSIHFEESHIRDDVDQSQRYFAYLLKSRLSQLELLRLIDSGFLSLAVQFFRNRLVTQALQQDLFKQIQKDINFSALKHKRKYSRKYSKIKNKLS